jgi:hypothetical protein
MKSTQAAGQQARSKKTREARDFTADYEASMYRTANGKHGIPCSAFRNAMISACRTIGFKMTLAKLSIFIETGGSAAPDTRASCSRRWATASSRRSSSRSPVAA